MPFPEELDGPEIYERLDSGGMAGLIADLPQQLRRAVELTASLALLESHRRPREVVVLGMGGSAIAGDLAAALVEEIPLRVVRGYDLPTYVQPDALVVASSHSGQTEETLSAFGQAGQRGCPRLVITTGGRLAELAREEGLPLVLFAYPAPPRATVGYQLALLLGVLHRAGVYAAPDLDASLQEIARVAGLCHPEVLAASNPAKHLAGELQARLPIVYGAEHLSPVARRWKTQINENAKSFAAYEELPEADHNAVVGYEYPSSAGVALIFLETPDYGRRTAVRFEVTRELAKRQGHRVHTVGSAAPGWLAQMLGLIHLGDWTSYYLALLNGVDPTPVEAIDRLKSALASVG